MGAGQPCRLDWNRYAQLLKLFSLVFITLSAPGWQVVLCLRSDVSHRLNYLAIFSSCYIALGQAVQLADSLKKFPQLCMQADRKSAYYAAFSAKSLEDALHYEQENGKGILELVIINTRVIWDDLTR